MRWLTLACGAAFILVAAAYALWIGTSPDALRAVASEAAVRQYVEEDFIDYYSENPAASFAGAVWTNNAWISAQAVALGITGFWVPMILFSNAQGVGVAAGIFAAAGKTGRVLQLHPAARADGTDGRVHRLRRGAADLLGHGVAGPPDPGHGPSPRKAGP